MPSSIVHKLLHLVTVVSESQEPLSFSQVVEKTGLNKSTIHRLLTIGVEERMLRFDSQRKTYFLGSRIFDFVRGAYGGYDIQERALDEMVRLQALFDVNVAVGVPSGHEVMYLRVLDASHNLGTAQRPGMREPIHCSASGKALMASLPYKLLDARLKGYDFARFTAHTITNAENFNEVLKLVRAQGYAQNDREAYEHVIGIAAPIYNYLGEAIAVLHIWSSHPRHNIEDLRGFSHELIRSAAAVTTSIGGQKPILRL